MSVVGPASPTASDAPDRFESDRVVVGDCVGAMDALPAASVDLLSPLRATICSSRPTSSVPTIPAWTRSTTTRTNSRFFPDLQVKNPEHQKRLVARKLEAVRSALTVLQSRVPVLGQRGEQLARRRSHGGIEFFTQVHQSG